MKFLIAAEALVDRRGNWFEYLTTTSKQFRASGDEVKIAANQNVTEEILNEWGADAVFPENAWRKDGKAQTGLGRLRQLLKHNGELFKAADQYINNHGEFDGHGAGEGFDPESVDSLYRAIETAFTQLDGLKTDAPARRTRALEHYLAATFKSYLKTLTGFHSAEQKAHSIL